MTHKVVFINLLQNIESRKQNKKRILCKPIHKRLLKLKHWYEVFGLGKGRIIIERGHERSYGAFTWVVITQMCSLFDYPQSFNFVSCTFFCMLYILEWKNNVLKHTISFIMILIIYLHHHRKKTELSRQETDNLKVMK